MPKRNLLLGLLIILIIIILFFSFHKSNSAAIPYYSVDQIDLNKERAFNVSVHIQNKLSNDDLRLVASKVKEDIHAISDIGKVFFYLPEMEINNGAWAVAEFNPEIEIHIIGLSVEREDNVKTQGNDIRIYTNEIS